MAASCSSGPGSRYFISATCHYNLWPWDDQTKNGNTVYYGKTASLVSCGWNHTVKNPSVGVAG
jgi:hypothetical protein